MCAQIGGYDLIDLDRAGLGYDEEIIGMDGMSMFVLTKVPPHVPQSYMFVPSLSLSNRPFSRRQLNRISRRVSVRRRDCRRLCVLCLEVARLSGPSD